MKVKLLLGLLFASFVSTAQASTIGNGGDVVVCLNENGSLRKIQLLDHFEGEFNDFPIDLGGPELGIMAKIEVALARLAVFSPKRAERYRASARDFLKNISFYLKAIHLEDIPDSAHIGIEDNCKIEQIALADPPRPWKHPYIIDQRLWDKLDKTAQAGLILHEIIYREARTYGHINSISARIFNFVISSPVIETWTMKQFLDHLRDDLAFPETDLSGLPVTLHLCRVHELSAKRACTEPKDIEASLALSYHQSGNLKSIMPAQIPGEKPNTCFGLKTRPTRIGSTTLHYQNDWPNLCTVMLHFANEKRTWIEAIQGLGERNIKDEVRFSGTFGEASISLSAHQSVEFWSDGAVRRLPLGTDFKSSQGPISWTFDYLVFSAEGHLRTFSSTQATLKPFVYRDYKISILGENVSFDDDLNWLGSNARMVFEGIGVPTIEEGLVFDSHGNLRQLMAMPNAETFAFWTPNSLQRKNVVSIRSGERLDIFPSKALQSAILARDQSLETRNGVQEFSAASRVYFDEEGYALKAD